jgi:flagellar protein FliS
MYNDPRQTYLETQVLTATPQKLRLMLIDGAIRAASRAVELMESADADAAKASLVRCREIVSELLVSVRPEPSSINKATQALYAFIFRQVAEAEILFDAARVKDALRVLHEERETWLQVCELMPDAPEASHGQPEEILAPSSVNHSSAEAFSLDA